MISRVQGLPAGYMVTGSDLKNVAGGFPDAEGMYSLLLWRNVTGYIVKFKKIQDLVFMEVRRYVKEAFSTYTYLLVGQVAHVCHTRVWGLQEPASGFSTLRLNTSKGLCFSCPGVRGCG